MCVLHESYKTNDIICHNVRLCACRGVHQMNDSSSTQYLTPGVNCETKSFGLSHKSLPDSDYFSEWVHFSGDLRPLDIYRDQAWKYNREQSLKDKYRVICYKKYFNKEFQFQTAFKKCKLTKKPAKRIKALMTAFWLQALFWIVPFYHFNQYEAGCWSIGPFMRHKQMCLQHESRITEEGPPKEKEVIKCNLIYGCRGCKTKWLWHSVNDAHATHARTHINTGSCPTCLLMLTSTRVHTHIQTNHIEYNVGGHQRETNKHSSALYK